jgi:hypothetical protein
MSFDDPEGGKCYCVYDAVNGRREIAASDPAIHGNTGDYDWYYRDNGNTWSKAGIDNSYLSAVSMAVSLGTNNQMTAAEINSLSTTDWNTGFANNVTKFDMTATLRSSTATATPSVMSAILSVDETGEEMRSIGGDGADYRVWSTNGDKTVYKQGSGTANTTIKYIE